MQGNVVLITGTSTGLGMHTALQLAANGYKVYATMRDFDKRYALLDAAAAQQVKLDVSVLDVSDIDTINSCVDRVLAYEGKIDVLINNAGAGFVRNTEQASMEEIQKVLDTNFLGVVRCTKIVLPHMRQARSGHIINIGSVGGLVGQPFNELYCAAKFAVEGYTEALATYVTPAFNVKFTIVEPGGIRTEFRNNVFKQVNSSGGILEDAYKPLLESYIASGESRSSSYQSAEEVALLIAGVVAAENPPLRIRTSTWAEKFCEYKTQSDPTGLLQVEDVARNFGQQRHLHHS
ncbi:SDR family oxidoreductase [Chitinophaga sp. HK235]|uniref:SDR family oxidoreductase n=1 Tax=Chitinophaga sp. HK235 TaxID=2952571 RepID=UPI001BA63B41|nr:SDR family oxidoreductase [Chitinophaga sp. HK235]